MIHPNFLSQILDRASKVHLPTNHFLQWTKGTNQPKVRIRDSCSIFRKKSRRSWTTGRCRESCLISWVIGVIATPQTLPSSCQNKKLSSYQRVVHLQSLLHQTSKSKRRSGRNHVQDHSQAQTLKNWKSSRLPSTSQNATMTLMLWMTWRSSYMKTLRTKMDKWAHLTNSLSSRRAATTSQMER